MIIFATLSLIIWIYLITARGNFWLCNQFLESQILKEKLNITIIIPARNEAENISICLESLLNQDYQGDFKIILVNDQSEDNTAQIAENLARKKSNSSTNYS